MPAPYREGCGTSGAQLSPLVADSARIATTSVPVIWDFFFRLDWQVSVDALASLPGVLGLVVDDDGGVAAGGGHDHDYARTSQRGRLRGRRWH